LRETRQHAAGRRAEVCGLGRHVPPAEDLQRLRGDDRGDKVDDRARLLLFGGQEDIAHCVAARRRQVETRHRAQEGVGHLDRDARPVAGGRFGSGCSPVVEVVQRGERLRDDPVAGPAVEIRDECDAARVVLVRRVVETA
jgi:hypothetical protein